MSGFVGTQIEFIDAVLEGLRSEMHRNREIVCFTASPGRVSTALAQTFGGDRLVETAVGAPIVLAASGAADEGLRTVCEIGPQYGTSAALEQIAELGALHAAGGGPCPVTIRISVGDPLTDAGAAGFDPFGFLIGSPGIKVVEPATPADAKGLIVSALQDDEPVCVLEHAQLENTVDTVPEGAHTVEIGRARLARSGERLTVVAHGSGVAPSEQSLDQAGVEADLIDLRTLQPLDTDAVLTSVRETGRVLIVESSPGGERITSAVVSAVWEQAFEYLDAPPRRVAVNGGFNGGAERAAEAIRQGFDDVLAY